MECDLKEFLRIQNPWVVKPEELDCLISRLALAADREEALKFLAHIDYLEKKSQDVSQLPSGVLEAYDLNQGYTHLFSHLAELPTVKLNQEKITRGVEAVCERCLVYHLTQVYLKKAKQAFLDDDKKRYKLKAQAGLALLEAAAAGPVLGARPQDACSLCRGQKLYQGLPLEFKNKSQPLLQRLNQLKQLQKNSQEGKIPDSCLRCALSHELLDNLSHKETKDFLSAALSLTDRPDIKKKLWNYLHGQSEKIPKPQGGLGPAETRARESLQKDCPVCFQSYCRRQGNPTLCEKFMTRKSAGGL